MVKKSAFIIALFVLIAGFTAFSLIKKEQDGSEKKTQSISSTPSNQKTAFVTKTVSFGSVNSVNAELFYTVKGRYTRAVTKDILGTANLLNDIIPFYPLNWITTYREVEISTGNNGQKTKAVSKNNELSAEQKSLLRSAGLATEIEITVKYSAKNDITGAPENRQMNLSMTVIPEKEAEFNTGYEQLIGYFKENTGKNISDLNPGTFQNASMLFTVTEEGQIAEVQLAKTSGYTKVDNLLLELIRKMPAWKPAENSKGLKVKQEFEFTLGPSGC